MYTDCHRLGTAELSHAKIVITSHFLTFLLFFNVFYYNYFLSNFPISYGENLFDKFIVLVCCREKLKRYLIAFYFQNNTDIFLNQISALWSVMVDPFFFLFCIVCLPSYNSDQSFQSIIRRCLCSEMIDKSIIFNGMNLFHW